MYVSTIRKIIKQQYLLHMSGPLTAEIGWRVWGTLANFNAFRVLASLLQRRRSMEVNQTLSDVWPSPELVHYIYIFGALATYRNSARCKIHFASKYDVILYWQRYCTALELCASARLCGVVSSRDRAAMQFGIGWSNCLVLLGRIAVLRTYSYNRVAWSVCRLSH